MSDRPSEIRFAGRYSVLGAVMLAGIMGPIDASIVNVVLPTISREYLTDISTVQWVPTVYLLTISSLLLFHGRLGDILGYRKVYLTGLAGFIVASVLCGLSLSISVLIAFRALQGLAAGMMMAVSFAIITASFPPEERGRALGINAISISAGLAIGPSLGGFIASAFSWRYVFFINVPIGLAGLLWGRAVIPDSRGESGRMDLWGVVSGFFGLLLFLLFVNRFQVQGVSLLTTAMLLLSLLAAFVFVHVERTVMQPVLPLSLFRDATFSLACASALLNFMSQYVMVFLTPFYLQRVLHYAPVRVGLMMSAFPVAVILVAPWSGALSDRVGTSILACAGAALCAFALFLMSQLPDTAGSGDIVWRLALFGLGTGIFQSPNNSAVMGSAPRGRLGVASGVLSTMRNVGMVLGIASGGALLYGFTPSRVLQQSLLDAQDATAFLSGLTSAYCVGGILTAVASLLSLARGRRTARS